MTQEQLAHRLGVSYQAVSKWENEQSCPEITLLPLLSDVFQVSIDELFGKKGNGDIRKGLIAEYLFEGDAQDSSGKDHHGTVFGAVPCVDRFGNRDSAYSFDGNDDYIVIDPAPPLNPEAFSLSIWCCYDQGAKLEGWNSAIVSQDGHFKNRVFQLSTLDHQMTFHRFLNDPDLYIPSSLQKEYWYHIAVTYSNHLFKLYQNGILIHECQGTLTPCLEEPIFIGRKATDEPYFFFKGKIDDFRIYDRALELDEVNALYVENGWVPAEPVVPAAVTDSAMDAPVLDSVANVQLQFPRKDIKSAAQWYIHHLGFKLHMEHPDEFYMLTLFNGPNLYLHSSLTDHAIKESFPHFVYRTKRPVEQLKAHLIAAGALDVQVRNEGFAHFICFEDPFGKSWMVKREKR
ncbi:LamG-like jellyroll fold domain-containing protein [Marinicrinis lubricantis]